MKTVSIIVRATWDDEAGVWVASTADIAGLAVEADTLEELTPKIMAAIHDLLEMNGLDDIDEQCGDIPVHIMAEQVARVRKSEVYA